MPVKWTRPKGKATEGHPVREKPKDDGAKAPRKAKGKKEAK